MFRELVRVTLKALLIGAVAGTVAVGVITLVAPGNTPVAGTASGDGFVDPYLDEIVPGVASGDGFVDPYLDDEIVPGTASGGGFVDEWLDE